MYENLNKNDWSYYMNSMNFAIKTTVSDVSKKDDNIHKTYIQINNQNNTL